MPPTSTVKHPHCNLSIKFTEADHRYVDNEGAEYTSVTTIIKGAFLPFNAQQAAERVAKREGGTVAEVLATWEMKRLASSDFGTRFHANMEATIKGQPRPNAPKTEKEIQTFKVGVETAKKLMARFGDGLQAEKIVFSPFYKIAGCIDLIAVKGNDVFLGDWKTNEVIKKENPYQSCAVYSLQHLADCDYVKYSLQLSMYERILRSGGYIPEGASVKRMLIHIPPGADKPEFIETPDVNREMAEILLDKEMSDKLAKEWK